MYAPHTPLMNLSRANDRTLDCASRLRGEAIDDFWRGADAMLERGRLAGQDLLARSAQRLHSRLTRRQRRAAPLEG